MTALLLAAAALGASLDGALAQRRKAAPQPQQPSADRRDQVVAAPGTPFHGKPYWLAMAQCAGIYFKLGNLYAEEAMRVRAAKPDPAAASQLNTMAESAGRSAAVFFDLAERFLRSDRGVSQEDAVHAYDGQAVAAGDRLKSVDDARKAAESCPALHETCRSAVPKICSDKSALAD